VKDGQSQTKAAAVPDRDKQAAEIRSRAAGEASAWAWVEATVWTERMLTALENGVKGNVWFSLIDKVCSERNLWSSWAKVAANAGSAGVDHVTVQMYEQNVELNLTGLSEKLRREEYQPSAIRRVHIPKPGSSQTRPLGIPTVQDRVVQTALRHVLEPIFEKEFARHSYGFRPGRGCKDALRRVDELLKAGYTYVVDADLKSYFDTIPHGPLMERVRERVADGRALKLVEAFLTQGVMEGLSQWTPASGAPQGAVVSPLLSNIYLNPLDHLMEQSGWEMVRYADDFVILCQSEPQAREALERVRQWTAQAGLTLHPEKTRIVDARTEGFDFLGYHFEGGKKWPRKKSEQKLKDTIRIKTRRTSGRSLPCVIEDVNRTLRGWFEYFKHSVPTTFNCLDGWIRMRLRSILRKRQHKRGRGRGSDHRRWPNRYFAEMGLYSLVAAHRLACQSANKR
jgi:RNA-directed DNA polymerase